MFALAMSIGNQNRGRTNDPGITASETPAMSPLYDGQAVEDVTNWSTFTNTANYSSTAGTIVSAVPAFTGDATAADDALVEDETAGFTITVTDSESNVRVFPATAITVQYKLTFTQNGDNEGEIDINPLVGDDVELGDIVVGSGPHAATYSGITAGDIRGGPYNFGAANSAGLPQITYSGDVGDLTVDDVLTALPGLWATSTGNLTFSYQWQADGVDISGATSSTFAITAGEQGTDVTVEVTGDNGVNATVMAESAAMSIPEAAPALAVERVVADYLGSATYSSTQTFPLDLSGHDTGTLILVPYGNEDFLTGGTLQGNAMTLEQISTGAAGGAKASLLSYVLTAPGTASESLVLSLASSQQYNVVDVWAVAGGAIVSKTFQQRLDSTPFNISVTPDNANNVILAFVTGRQNTGTAFTWDTLTEVDDERVAAGNHAYMSTAWAQDVPSGVAYSITGSLAGTVYRHSMIAVALTPV